MKTPEFNESQLLADIDQLRAQFPHTQDLYREVCVLLFFRYGVTPTTNRLYQLVRKGSMSAPAEALNKFWEDLRDKSRVRIEHPDLPESLKTAAGDLIATLWSAAQGAAQEGLAALRGEAQAQVAEARQAQVTAEADRDAARSSYALVSRTLEQAHVRVGELQQAVAARDATIIALETQLRVARNENTGLLQKLDEARQDFGLDLEKLQAAAELADERFRAAEARALMEIDHERMTKTKLQKELEASKSAITQSAERRRVEVAELNEQLGNLRQRVGELEGELKSVTGSRDLARDDLKHLRSLLDDKSARASFLETVATDLGRQLEQANATIQKMTTTSKRSRGANKSSA